MFRLCREILGEIIVILAVAHILNFCEKTRLQNDGLSNVSDYDVITVTPQ